MKKYLLILLLLLVPVYGWGATYYSRIIAGTIYYKSAEWPVATDTSAASLQAMVNALDNGGHTLVLDAASAWTGANGTITFAGDNITIRAPLSTDPEFATYGGRVTIGPSASADYIIKIGTARTGITLSGAITFAGYNGFNFGTVSIQSTANNINISRTWDNGAWQTPIITSANDASDFPIYIFGDGTGDPSNIVLDGLDIRNYRVDTQGIKINTADAGTGNEIKNCTIMNYTPHAAGTIAGSGIFLIDSNRWSIHDNIIGNTTYRWQNGIRFQASDNNLIYNNTISYCWDGDNYPDADGYGITVQTSSENNLIYKNLIQYSNRGVGLSSNAGAGGNTVFYNVIANSPTNGIDVTASMDAYELVYNNTVYHRPTSTSGHGIVVQSTGKKAKIYNNIVDTYTMQNRPHNIQCIAIADTAGPSVYTVEIDYNLYYVTGTAYVGAEDETNMASLSDWTTAIADNTGIIGKDAHSVSVDPLFISATNYRLSNTSPAISAGTFITGVHDQPGATDYEGKSFYCMPSCDIGAYSVVKATEEGMSE